ncbi:hypothetical protein EUX98_g2657 [Antrodiella citrinella]|uniref:Uncharacterized protein n=1 Tax=Antrodiella citrinella TaxID=2447956 RepID=A0A4S4N1E5_9APHY|nr:hypothetical protein EUX98_g2657 [Antrodiella citrinella]
MTTPSSPSVAIVASSPSTPAIAEKRTQDLPQSQIVHTPYVPKRKAVPFPFVSGGYLKDFVTTPTQPELAMQSSVHKEPESQSQDTSSTVRLAALPQTPAPAPAPAPSTPAPPTLLPSPPLPPPPPTEPSRASPPPPPPPQARTKAVTPPSNHAASSSKVKVEDIPPSGVANDARDIASRPSNSEYDPSPAPPKARAAPPQPSYFRSPVAPYPPYIPRSQPGAIPRTKPGFIPAVPARALHPSLTATFPSAWQPWQRAEEPSPPRSPPPAPKVIAHIPSGSYSNPLNIQPARAVPLSSRVPEAGSVNVQSPAGSKKPVVVGNGWPYNTRSHAKANAAGTNGTARTQPAKTPVSDAAAVATPTPEALSGSGAPSTSAHSPTPPTTGEPAPSTTPQPDQSGKSGPPALRVSLSGVTSYQNVYVSGPGPAAASTSSSSSTPAPAPAPRLTPTPTATTPSHPLPPKPPAFTGTAAGSYSPRRGVKRMVSPTPLAPDSKVKTDFAWATGDPVHCVRIKADGDAGIRTITFNSDGTQFAIACWDKSVRIWNRRSRQEIAKLGHNMQVIAVAWMDHDSGVITLGDNGILSTWTRNAQNKWMWAKLLDVNAGRQMKESPSCLAFVKDRIAIALPTEGVKVWTFMKGTWINQRSIGRQKVTALKFVDEGEALVGGTEDGTLWHCEVPNGTLKALKIFTKAPISSLETDVRGQIGLTTLADGRCELVNVRLDANKGSVEQSFTVKDMELPGPFTHTFGAVFVSSGQSVVHGSVRGCVMVWDRSAGDVVYGLKHGEEDSVNTVSSFNGTANLAGLILTGTRSGQLTWFTHPPTDAGPNRKRVKI